MKIAVFGLGKLGSVLAALHAAKGHDVVGVDLAAASVSDINAGKAPVQEPGLQDLIDQAGGRLRATLSAAEALEEAEASYIIVPTPSDSHGVFTNEYLLVAMRQIGESLTTHDRRHTVVITSTVMPRSCDGEIRAALEESSGRRVGEGIGLVYSPEFIALGSIVKDMKFPDLTLIGESDPEAGALAEANALSVTERPPTIRRMTLVNAELTKISINTFVTTKISYANMLAEMCDELPGADVDVVTAAVGADSRIGTKYLKGALGYGGPCFPRDNIALSRVAESLGLDADIARATDAINDRQVDRVVELVTKVTPSGSPVAVLGMSYKPDTPICEESQGVQIANGIAHNGLPVTVHDPLALEDAQNTLDDGIKSVTKAADALADSHTVVITTPWPEYRELSAEALRGKVVVDCWGLIPTDLAEARQVLQPGKLRANDQETLNVR